MTEAGDGWNWQTLVSYMSTRPDGTLMRCGVALSACIMHMQPRYHFVPNQDCPADSLGCHVKRNSCSTYHQAWRYICPSRSNPAPSRLMSCHYSATDLAANIVDDYVTTASCADQDCTLSVYNISGLTTTLAPAMGALSAALINEIPNNAKAIIGECEIGSLGIIPMTPHSVEDCHNAFE